MAFVSNVESDQQSRNLLYDACILQFAAIDSAHSGNLGSKLARELRCGDLLATGGVLA